MKSGPNSNPNQTNSTDETIIPVLGAGVELLGGLVAVRARVPALLRQLVDDSLEEFASLEGEKRSGKMPRFISSDSDD